MIAVMNECNEHLSEDVYDFLGHRIGLRSNSTEVLEYFRSVYARFYRGQGSAESENERRSTAAAERVIEAIDNIAGSQELLLKDDSHSYRLRCEDLYTFDYDYYSQGTLPDPLAFITYLFLENIHQLAGDYQLIHAGAVSWKNQGIIFPGLSGMGKTTLTVKLVMSGFRFLSDEMACLHPDRDTIEPFYRKLNITEQSNRLLGLAPRPESKARFQPPEQLEWSVDIEEIVSSSLSEPCPLRYILFLQGFGEKPRLEHVSSANALFKLFKFSLNPVDDHAVLLYKFAPLLDRVKCFNLVLGNLRESVEVVLELVEGRGGDKAVLAT